jgi:hypothetical protein
MSEEAKKVAENEEAKVETEETAPEVEETAEVAAEDKAEETPAEDAAEEKTEETPATEEAAEEKVEDAPAEEAAEEKTEDAPAEEAAEGKTEDTPATEEAAEEKVEDAPAEEDAAEDKAEGTPAEEDAEEKTEDAPAEEDAAEEKAEDAPAEEDAKAKAKPRTTLRFLLLIVLLAVAWFAWQKHQRDARFNKLIEMADSGNLAGAAAGFSKLMGESSGDLKKRCKQELVRIILEQGDAPSNNVQQSVVYYQQAYAVDPNGLEMHHLRALLNQLKKDKDEDPAMAETIKQLNAVIKKRVDAAAAALKAQRDAMTPEEKAAEAKALAEAEAEMKGGAPIKKAVKKLPVKQ